MDFQITQLWGTSFLTPLRNSTAGRVGPARHGELRECASAGWRRPRRCARRGPFLEDLGRLRQRPSVVEVRCLPFSGRRLCALWPSGSAKMPSSMRKAGGRDHPGRRGRGCGAGVSHPRSHERGPRCRHGMRPRKCFRGNTSPQRRSTARGRASSSGFWPGAVHVPPQARMHIEFENGRPVAVETARRLGCDGALVGVVEGAKGEPLAIGRRTRAVPPAIRRALRVRDGGCRFPGCDRSRHVHAHHIKHWADGGRDLPGQPRDLVFVSSPAGA